MSSEELTRRIHDLDVTVWVGKGGIDSVADEVTTQLDDHDLVKVKFLRSARGDRSAEELAVELASAAGGSVVQTRGHTAVIEG